VISLARRYRFSAAHVLAREAWSAEKNREVYGKCANPAGHGHNYEAEIWISGEPDPATGMILPASRLDELVGERVVARLDERLLNRDVPYFGRAVPTAENIARWIWDQLAPALPAGMLRRVRLVETPNNSVEYAGPTEEP
jgi:6-pyruvoyltetrahydropterin/6-carboxytetrahydropterin synthase